MLGHVTYQSDDGLRDKFGRDVKSGDLAGWVDGKPWEKDPASIPLRDRQTIVLSDAPTDSPPTVDFSELDG